MHRGRPRLTPPVAAADAAPAQIRAGVDPAAAARRLAPALHWPGAHAVEERCWRLVARTADFDAWLIAWPAGGRVALHDHGSSSGAISVLSGSLTEAVPRREGSGRLVLARNELCAGTILAFEVGHVHGVTNESPESAVSLHVYSPALTSMTHFDLADDRLVAREVKWVSGGDETPAHQSRLAAGPADGVAAR